MPETIAPELWSDETIAECHLNNALDEQGYRWAVYEVLSMGLDPSKLNPDHLILNDAPWRNPQLHLALEAVKRSS